MPVPIDLIQAALLLVTFALVVLLLWRTSRQPVDRLEQRLAVLEQMQERAERTLRDELGGSRRELQESAARGREETGRAVKDFGDSLLRCVGELSASQKGQFDTFAEQLGRLTSSNEQTVERLRRTVEERLKDLQADNSKKLDEMRQTVDEKLQGTLDRRLTESFRQVSERLEQVHKGLGEMQSLAVGVGDLKRVLTNVKLRGTWGEIQLETLLEQLLSPEQYEKNVAVQPGSSERVEFCIRLPGRSADREEVVWLPIDAKFPHEDYQRLVEAEERADPEAHAAAARQLEVRIKGAARDIRDKYIHPPRTTDFAILFLPTEGLYAELLRRPNLVETLQRDCRVVIAGPTTLAALLNSLQMGFRTLAIEKRSSEVWALLAAVKDEFGKFGELIGKVQKKLQEAANVIDQAASKSRTIERRLSRVQEVPAVEGVAVLDPLDGAPGTSEPAES
jgi:DNA recombination protein RmuC